MNAKALIFGVVLLLFCTTSVASTTCDVKDCKITITMKIAFAGADDAYINRTKNEIESEWNSQYWTFGDCKCLVSFKVEATKTADCVNNPPAGYHCITVTDYNNNPPRNQTNMTGATFYVGYMFGIANGSGGNSQSGWWSNIMSRPVDPANPNGEHYKDFAHEAGHMIGLEDGDGNLMNKTSGSDAKVTQELVDKAVEKVCGANACPDKCCCGNGVIDRNEQCDPMVGGCAADQYCCPVCCQCYGQICFPENGEYTDQQNCRANCGSNSSCYYNYKTGCWDCVKLQITPQYTIDNFRQIVFDNHTRQQEIAGIRVLYYNGLRTIPVLGDYLANERVNIIIQGENNYHIVFDAQGDIVELGGGALADPNIVITTDAATIKGIKAGEVNPIAAFKQGKIRIAGIGFFEGMKFWFVEFFVNSFISIDQFQPVLHYSN